MMPASADGARQEEDGSGSVLVLAVCVVALAMNLFIAGLAGAVTAARRAHSAADLGALAGAQQLLDAARTGRQVDPCGRAHQVVAANGAVLRTCHVAGDEVVVQTSLTVGGQRDGTGAWGSRLFAASARARAGPATLEVAESEE